MIDACHCAMLSLLSCSKPQMTEHVWNMQYSKQSYLHTRCCKFSAPNRRQPALQYRYAQAELLTDIRTGDPLDGAARYIFDSAVSTSSPERPDEPSYLWMSAEINRASSCLSLSTVQQTPELSQLQEGACRQIVP